jgi:AcrR family transcriptional regulator
MRGQEPTKDKILQETLRLFADRGYDSTTMNDIAGAVGIKAASLYAHYKGKEELFGAVFESALATWEGLVEGIFSGAEGVRDLEDGLNKILGDFVCAMMGSIAYRFWARVYVFPPRVLKAEDRQRIAAMDGAFAERLCAFCSESLADDVSPEDLELLGTSLSYFSMGLLMSAEIMDENAVRKAIRRGIAFHLKAIRTDRRLR